jgi:Clp amino terminal domain, pathogenicity island component
MGPSAGELPMFERFTDGARRVVVNAQAEARRLNHNYIGTEHLLLGLVSDDPSQSLGATALASFDISLDVVRRDVEEIIGRGVTEPKGHIPFTPRAKKVMELALREALQLGHNYIGTEHLLLGMIREGEGVAAQVLVKRGADLSRLRDRVIDLLVQRASGEEPAGELPHVRPTTRGPFTAGIGFLWAGPAPKLVRVVPLARHVEVGEDAQLVLLSLEIWSNWLDLRLATAGPPGTLPAIAYGDWTLSDDRGTRYQTSGVSFSGSQELQICQVSFQPSPPADAGTLTLTLPGEGKARDEIRVVVELA